MKLLILCKDTASISWKSHWSAWYITERSSACVISVLARVALEVRSGIKMYTQVVYLECSWDQQHLSVGRDSGMGGRRSLNCDTVVMQYSSRELGWLPRPCTPQQPNVGCSWARVQSHPEHSLKRDSTLILSSNAATAGRTGPLCCTGIWAVHHSIDPNHYYYDGFEEGGHQKGRQLIMSFYLPHMLAALNHGIWERLDSPEKMFPFLLSGIEGKSIYIFRKS